MQHLLDVVSSLPDVALLFQGTSPVAVFSPNPNTLSTLSTLPPVFHIRHPAFSMSIIAKYCIICLTSSISDQFLESLFTLLPTLPCSDQNILIRFLTPKLLPKQIKSAISCLPICGATFLFLAPLLLDQSLFWDAFCRIFSAFHEIPVFCLPYIGSYLYQSLRSGLAREHFLALVKLRLAPGAIDYVINRMVWTYPDSFRHFGERQMHFFFSAVKLSHVLPRSMLDLRLKTRSWSAFHFKQILHYLETCSSDLFHYFEQVPVIDQTSFWISNLAELPNTPEEHSFVVLWHFFLTLLRLPEMQSVIVPAKFLVWLEHFVRTMHGTGFEIPIFGICLLILRLVDQIAGLAFEQCHLAEGAVISLATILNPRPFAEILFWVIDPTRNCPFRLLLDEFGTFPSLPPPSRVFATKIMPRLLQVLINLAAERGDSLVPYVTAGLAELYDNPLLFPLLSEISNSAPFLSLMRFVSKSEECREFVVRALGLCCSFPVFKRTLPLIKYFFKIHNLILFNISRLAFRSFNEEFYKLLRL
jgi:hypothetical protein